MNKENIHIDLDENVIHFISENTNEKEDKINEYITDIVYIGCKENNVVSDNIFISITSATKEEIRKINKEYRNIDRATDVLSFPIFEKEELEKIKLQDEEKRLKEIELGDIILCLDVIKEQAKEYETGILRETLYMITHGVCHLLGYDHIIENDKKEMRVMEENILKEIGVSKDENKSE